MTEFKLSNYRVEELTGEAVEGAFRFAVSADVTDGVCPQFRAQIIRWLSEDEANEIAANPDLLKTDREYRDRELTIRAKRCLARRARADDPAAIAAFNARLLDAGHDLIEALLRFIAYAGHELNDGRSAEENFPNDFADARAAIVKVLGTEV